MQSIHDSLSTLTVGPAVFHGGLTMYPLLRGGEATPDYLTLDEALKESTLKITEISEGGQVPKLKLENAGDQPVFLLDGEELIGCKQNRVLNLTILAPAGKTIDIPVSCVEQGRWSSNAPAFHSSSRAQFARGRMDRMESVSASLCMREGPYSDQMSVWDTISDKAAKLGGRSATGAMGSIYESREQELDGYTKAFRAAPGQVGALFAVNGHSHGLDLFDSAATLAKYLPKLIRSHALDAIEARVDGEQDQAASRDAAIVFLQGLRNAEGQVFPAVGLGEDVRISASGLTAAALVAEGRTVHLCAFESEKDDAEGPSGARLRRAALRRARWERAADRDDPGIVE